jgi:outer membrane protein OmpA-like peptidoglycan-associated protein
VNRRRQYLFTLLAPLTLSLACAAMPKPEPMATYEEESTAERAEVVVKRYPELAENAKKHHAIAVEAHDDKEEELLAHHAKLLFLWWRAATSRSHADDLVAEAKRLDKELAEAEKDLVAAQKHEELTKSGIALQRKVFESEGGNEAREAINQALSALKEAERVDAHVHAKAKYTEADKKLNAATDALKNGKDKQAITLAQESETAAASAKAEAEPIYATTSADRERNASQRKLFEQLNGIAGVTASIVEGGVRVTIIQSFEVAGVDIKPEMQAIYNAIADAAKAHKKVSLLITGHTDTKGNRTKNLQLSESRARSVMGYLASKGVEPNRVSAIGKGSEAPVANNKTKEGRAQNRRIEILFSTPGGV